MTVLGTRRTGPVPDREAREIRRPDAVTRGLVRSLCQVSTSSLPELSATHLPCTTGSNGPQR